MLVLRIVFRNILIYCSKLLFKLSYALNKFLYRVTRFESLYDPYYGCFKRKDGKLNSTPVEVEVGNSLYWFVRLVKPTYILETGTNIGYSTTLLARGIRDTSVNGEGKIFTIDPVKHVHLWSDQPDLNDSITFIQKFSRDVTNEDLDFNTFDMLVLDSDHTYNNVMRELIQFEPLLKPGGYILMHDSFYFDGVGAAVKQLMENERFEVVTLETPRREGNPESRCCGLTVVYKKSSGPENLTYETEYDNWEIGNPESTPFIRQS